jgi:Glycosyl hydrolases family 28
MKKMEPGSGIGSSGALNVKDLGAVGDGQTSSTAAIQAAIDRCGQGGGTVVVPPGEYVTGTLRMRSHVQLHLEAGARLLGSQNAADYPVGVSRWEGKVKPSHTALIAGEELTNVAITGRGVIDGRGQYWWDLFNGGRLEHQRPKLLRLVNCRDVLIDGITCENASFWTLNPTACNNLTISRVTVRNPPDSPNTDGINPDSCSNVHISDCHIDVGDDCVAIKSGCEDDGRRELLPCENITVTNCTMLRGHGGVVIGSETSGGVRNVAISNCVFNGTDRGIRVKSRRGRGGVVEDVRVDNVVMDSVICPIVLYLFYGCGAWDQERVTDRRAYPVNAGTPRVRRLRFSNISARRVRYAAMFVLGLPEMNIQDVTVDGLSVHLDSASTAKGSPAMAPGIPDMCRAGIVMENARDIKIRQTDIHDQLGPAVTLRNCSDMVVSDLSARRDGKSPLVVMDEAEFERIEDYAAALGGQWRRTRLPSRAGGNGNGKHHGAEVTERTEK